MKAAPTGDTTKVWAFGKVQPGWYVAKWVWNQAYASHLETLGFKVQRSINKPESSA